MEKKILLLFFNVQIFPARKKMLNIEPRTLNLELEAGVFKSKEENSVTNISFGNLPLIISYLFHASLSRRQRSVPRLLSQP